MKMQEVLLRQSTFFYFFFVLIVAVSSQPVELFVEKEAILDLSGASNNHQQIDEWIIKTDPNHILYFSFLNANDIDELLLSSSLTIMDSNKADSNTLFPAEEKNLLSPFYSTGNAVSTKFIKSSSLNAIGFRLKVEKAVTCPFNLGSGSSCGRVVDELSCYCALYTLRTWENTKSFCNANNMSFVSIETVEEDMALLKTFGGNDIMWIGLSDTTSEGTWLWDSTGKKMSPGYVGWIPSRPISTGVACCSTCEPNYDCAYYGKYTSLPAWHDETCSNNHGGICELQPSSSSTVVNRFHEL